MIGRRPLTALLGFMLPLTPVEGSPLAQPDSTISTPLEKNWAARFVPLGAGIRKAMVFSSLPLDRRTNRIDRAVIVVHGAGRDADEYFRTARAAAFLDDRLEDTIIIAPRFGSDTDMCHDQIRPGEMSWPCENWKFGVGETTTIDGESYHLLDILIEKLSDKRVFPNLKQIVLVGHSAGGQFVVRYALTNNLDGKVDVHLRYLVANPSSYPMPDAERPVPEEDETRPHTVLPRADPPKYLPFGPYEHAQECPAYNDWPYGLAKLRGYALRAMPTMVDRFAQRDVTYMLGQQDNVPLAGFDDTCWAMAQGSSRYARGIAFWDHMKTRYGAIHRLVVVPLCGHNARCMLTSPVVMPLLFGRPADKVDGRTGASRTGD